LLYEKDSGNSPLINNILSTRFTFLAKALSGSKRLAKRANRHRLLLRDATPILQP